MVIYKVTCLINGKVYVGQTTGTMLNRWNNHVYSSKTGNSVFYRSIKKYGKENFLIEQLYSATTLEELNLLEEKFIKEFNCLHPKGFNLLPGGNNRRHHANTKLKLIQALKGRSIPNRWNKGFVGKHSQPTKDKIAAKLKGRPIKNRMNGAPKGRPVSLERKARISASLKGRPQPNKYRAVMIIQTGIIYESVTAAFRALGIERTNLLHYLKSGKIHKKSGFSFKYVENKCLKNSLL